MKTIAIINEFSIEAIRDALQKLDDFENLTVNGLTAFQLNEIENIDPSLFKQIENEITNNRWYPFVGTWAVENEKISEDQLIRNVMYSALYFKNKFGKEYRVFTGKTIYNNYLPQIIYLGGFDAAVIADENKKYWLDSADNSRTLVFGEKCGDINIADVNDIDDEFIADNEFSSFENEVIALFDSWLDLEAVKLPTEKAEVTQMEKLLVDAEKISAYLGENRCDEIREGWFSLFAGDEKSAKKTAEKIIASRIFDSNFLKMSGGINLVTYKFAEDMSGDKIIRIKETDGKEKSATVMCNAIGAGFRCEIMPYEMQTFRIDNEGFVKETLLTE